MKTVGIVIAKDTSKRFPGKNKHIVDGEPLFWHSVKPLKESQGIDDVYVATNSEEIKNYCEQRGVKVIWRGPNVSEDEEPLFSVVKYTYKSLEKSYDTAAVVMANCPGHRITTITDAIHILIKNNLREVRSYDSNGVESGLLVFNTEIFKEDKISAYVGAITSDVKEIHRIEDLDDR